MLKYSKIRVWPILCLCRSCAGPANLAQIFLYISFKKKCGFTYLTYLLPFDGKEKKSQK